MLSARPGPAPRADPSGEASPRAAALRRGDALILVALGIGWFWTLASSGALSPAYQLIDDHEILRIAADVDAQGFLRSVRQWVTNDVATYQRFRPLYYLHRVCEAAAFGDDLLAWSIYTGALGLLSSSSLYVALRLLRFSAAESLAAAFFVLVGDYGPIWWRRGPAETIGLALLSLAVLALAWLARSGCRAARISFLAAAIGMSLCKESFTLFLPALALALAAAVRWHRGGSVLSSVRSCVVEWVVLGAAFTAEILFIKMRLRSGAGAPGLGADEFVKAAWALTGYGRLWWVIAAACVLGLFAGGVQFIRGLAAAAVLWASMVVPQAVLYARPSVYERYYVPGFLGTLFLLAWSIRAAREGLARRWPSWSASRWGWATGLAALVALVPLARERAVVMYGAARAFADEGRSHQAFLDRISSPSCGRPVLIAGGMTGMYEVFWSIHFYLENRARRGGELFHFVPPREPLNQFDQNIVRFFRSRPFLREFDPRHDSGPAPCVGILKGDEDAFLAEASWFDRTAYAREEAHGFVVYRRR